MSSRTNLAAAAVFCLGGILGLPSTAAHAANQQDDCTCTLRTQRVATFHTITVRTEVPVTWIEEETVLEPRLVSVVKYRDEEYEKDVPYMVSRVDCGCAGPGHIEYRKETRIRRVRYTDVEWQDVPVRHPVKKTRMEVHTIRVPAQDVEKYARVNYTESQDN